MTAEILPVRVIFRGKKRSGGGKKLVTVTEIKLETISENVLMAYVSDRICAEEHMHGSTCLSIEKKPVSFIILLFF